MGLKNGYWVLPGKLAAGEYPGSQYSVETKLRVKKLLHEGITAFVDLTEDFELEPYDPFLPENVEYARIPIKDMGIPTKGTMDRILQKIETWLSDGKVVYVHCWGGIGRTGTVVGCFLKSRGEANPLEKVQELYLGGMSTDKIRRHPESPQTPAQCRFVDRWGTEDEEESGEASSYIDALPGRRMVSIRGKWTS